VSWPPLLASVANRAAFPRPSCLFGIDLNTQRREWIDVKLNQLVASGLGIFADQEFIYHVCLSSPNLDTYLIVFDRSSLSVVDIHPLEAVRDGHSVLRHEGELLVVSTGTDEIISYPLHGSTLGQARVLWTPTGSGTDTHHVNSVALLGDDILCSAFGPKDEGSWSTAQHGYIQNISIGENLVEGLQQPHSTTCRDGEVFFCNSLEGTVNSVDDTIAYLNGYSRGLAFAADGTLYAATSLSRRPSDPNAERAVFRNPGDDGELHGHCAIIQISGSGGSRLEISLAEFANEIYDLLVL
jgi:hypothetical protein